MAITRHDPFRDMLQLQDQLFRTFEGAYGQRGGEETRELATWSPPVDVFEDNDAITLTVELPEIDPKDVDIRVEGNTLTLRGERKLERADQRDGYSRIERTYGAFSRTFTLPSSVDVDHIQAESKDGVMRLVLPKKPETKPRQIKVQVGGSQSVLEGKH
jgi:HSP20 family protein